MTDIIERLEIEADLCRNDGADDIAKLLYDARAEISALRASLLVAVDLAEEGLSYTPPYFREKWSMDDTLKFLQADPVYKVALDAANLSVSTDQEPK